MDMVNNQIPTFEDKAEALHYFPLFRTWFGLQGLCKLPWNDIEPPDNAEKYPGPEAAKVPAHVDNYLKLYTGITGKPLDRNEPDSRSRRRSTTSSACSTCGWARARASTTCRRTARSDPVTKEEYESRADATTSSSRTSSASTPRASPPRRR